VHPRDSRGVSPNPLIQRLVRVSPCSSVARGSAGVILSFFAAVFGATAQQAPSAVSSTPQPPRDAVRRAEPVGPVGTGVIKGRVVAADTGNPIRRANVSLSPIAPPLPPGSGRGASGPPATLVPGSPGSSGSPQASGSLSSGPRQATTNSQGAFEFTGLAAGSYRIFANANQYSPQYLGMAFGGKKPMGFGSGDTGLPVQLGDGQSFDKVIIALPRGGVITGRVTDENGEPLTRVQVYTILFPPGSSRGMRTGSGGQTDDLGQFRIYGLQPGDHAVHLTRRRKPRKTRSVSSRRIFPAPRTRGPRSVCAPVSAPRHRELKSASCRIACIASPAPWSIHRVSLCLASTVR